jgi:hypothetical protein
MLIRAVDLPPVFPPRGRDTMTLALLVSIAENGPWCGTHPPGHPHPPRFLPADHGHEQPEDRLVKERIFGPHPEPWRFGPSPEPWRLGVVEVGLYGAIALHQTGRIVPQAISEAYTSAASALFDETCGSIPLSELVWILLNRPPPPPPQWLNMLTSAGETLAVAEATDQEGLARAASRHITDKLKAFGFQTEQAR